MCHRARERGLSKGKVALNAVGYKKKEEKKKLDTKRKKKEIKRNIIWRAKH